MPLLGTDGVYWRIGNKLGSGGFGVVYSAECQDTGERAVVKRARIDVAPAALRREAEIMSAINHPNVISIYDVVRQDGRLWIVMERATCTLRAMIDTYGPRSETYVIRKSIELLQGLRAVHRERVIHRDVHVDNVLVKVTGRSPHPGLFGRPHFTIKLSDFGISKMVDEYDDIVAFTQIGRGFDIAPELFARGYTTQQSDIYQAGLCMYYMLTGKPALSDRDGPRRDAILGGVARRRADRLDSALGDIISMMLRRKDEYRFADAREVIQALRELDWGLQ